jgi:hypothetical protein
MERLDTKLNGFTPSSYPQSLLCSVAVTRDKVVYVQELSYNNNPHQRTPGQEGVRGRVQFSRGAWQMQLCRVGVNFGASGFVRFLGSLSFHLRGSGSGGENCSIYAMAASGRMQNDYNNNNDMGSIRFWCKVTPFRWKSSG